MTGSSKRIAIAVILSTLAVACAVALFMWVRAGRDQASREPRTLLSPQVERTWRRARLVHMGKLRLRLTEYLSSTGALGHASVYVEDLNSGVDMGVNERVPHEIASLLKVGVMMAWLKRDAEEPGLLTKAVWVDSSHLTPNDEIAEKMTAPMPPGQYRIITLIERMIIYSDNTAVQALKSAVSYAWMLGVYDDLGLPNPYHERLAGDTSARVRILSAKQYSRIFKALYNASYLDEEHSELALKLLTQTKFDLGLRAVLPEGTLAALKYGLLTDALHESGIVLHIHDPALMKRVRQQAVFQGREGSLRQDGAQSQIELGLRQ